VLTDSEAGGQLTDSKLWLSFAVQPISSCQEQVAQLWQRNRAKLDMFSINDQRYSQNHRLAYMLRAVKSM